MIPVRRFQSVRPLRVNTCIFEMERNALQMSAMLTSQSSFVISIRRGREKFISQNVSDKRRNRQLLFADAEKFHQRLAIGSTQRNFRAIDVYIIGFKRIN